MAITIRRSDLNPTYTPLGIAKKGVQTLSNTLSDENLSLYDPSKAGAYYKNAEGFITDRNEIQNALDAATNAAFDAQRQEAYQALNASERQNDANTRNAIASMRKSLAGSASSGGNVGAANATALQALLGLGQSNSQATTENIQNIQNLAAERQAALRENASTAIDTANSANASKWGVAESLYGSDQNAAGQQNYGTGQALGALLSGMDAANQSGRETYANIMGNLAVERTPKKTISRSTSTSTSTNRNTNYNYDKK